MSVHFDGRNCWKWMKPEGFPTLDDLETLPLDVEMPDVREVYYEG